MAKRRPPPLQIGFSDINVPAKRSVLYRNFHNVSGTVYLVEISRDKTKIYILLFENYESPHQHIGEALFERIAVKLMNDNANSFEKLVA